jgi:hypothetical protein
VDWLQLLLLALLWLAAITMAKGVWRLRSILGVSAVLGWVLIALALIVLTVQQVLLACIL